ncbi:hypothetical protein E2C01_033396 [Portunus trituberculatus]|uniref:Uncharacterized protein n=1 Tax=Portunus trituberculatus TaxID=210409 RepID=A0A5B7F3B4_PORTR|nr:hypothetical protein [Portunus trituberculatus]
MIVTTWGRKCRINSGKFQRVVVHMLGTTPHACNNQCVQQGTMWGHAGRPLNMGKQVSGVNQEMSTFRRKSGAGVLTSVHYQLGKATSFSHERTRQPQRRYSPATTEGRAKPACPGNLRQETQFLKWKAPTVPLHHPRRSRTLPRANLWCRPGKEDTASLHLPRRNWTLPCANLWCRPGKDIASLHLPRKNLTLPGQRGIIQGGRTHYLAAPSTEEFDPARTTWYHPGGEDTLPCFI